MSKGSAHELSLLVQHVYIKRYYDFFQLIHRCIGDRSR